LLQAGRREGAMSQEGVAAPDDPSAGPGKDWAGQFSRVVGVVRSFPYAVILTVGLVAIVGAFVRKVGGFQLVTEGSQLLILAVGAVLVVVGLTGPALESRRKQNALAGYRLDGEPLPLEATDVEFMFKVFYLAMPPAFVKRFEPPVEGASREAFDIMYSREFDRFQRSGLTRRVSDDHRYRMIKNDHRRGDQEALEHGSSMQVEFPDSYVDGQLSPILTYKRKIEHKGETYIVGWYLPVTLPEGVTGGEFLTVREQVGQAVFRPTVAKKDKGLRVALGGAVVHRADAT
jgi:hypothetical protein